MGGLVMSYREYDSYGKDGCDGYEEQRHVHEFQSSVKFTGREEERHNHRTAGVTGEAIPVGRGRHVHKLDENTDFADGHYHQICETTGVDIPIPGTNRHTHVICGQTSRNDGHCHKFSFITQVESPAD